MKSYRFHSVLPAAARCALWLACAAIMPAAAQTGAADTTRPAADTLRVYTGSEVMVRGASIVPGVARATQPVGIVTRSQIEAAGASDLAGAVAFAPGTFVKEYGGTGGLRTISLRGTSAQQSVLLIDGVRYRGSADGAFDLGNIPADAIERVEVVRGGNAALYGANALGGAVNIITRAAADRPASVSLRAGLGSFGERMLGADAGGGSAGHAWSAGVNAAATNGDYPFIFNEYGATSTVRRENADFSNIFGRAGWSYRGQGESRIGVDAQAFRSERGVPGAIVQGSREQLRARLEERELFAAARFSDRLGAWNLGATASARANGMRYRDPDARVMGPAGIDSRFNGRDLAARLRAGRGIGAVGTLDLSTEAAYATLDGDNLDPAAGSSVARAQWSLGATSSWFFEEGLFGWETAIDAGLRGDLFSDIDPAVSPSIGALLRAGSTPLRLRARAASSYRAPSFSEQYYLNYGNRDLRPERSLSVDAGGTYELADDLVLEGTFFTIATRDQILSIPRSPVSWSAANVARVLSRGVELAAVGSLFDGLVGLNLSYTMMRAEDRSGGATEGSILPYAPRELFNGIVDLRLGLFSIGASWEYVSHRYTLPSNEYASSLPRYLVAGASIASRLRLGALECGARLHCANLFDAEYQVVRAYPMPGRSLRLDLTVKYEGGE